MKNVARNAAIVFLTLSILVMLWEFRDAVLLFLLSLWFASAARPLVARLEARGISRGISIILVYFGVFLVLGALIYASSSRLLGELQLLSNRMIALYTRIWQDWPHGSGLERTVISRLPEPNQLFNFASTVQNPGANGVFGFASGLFGFLGQVGIALVMSIYWTSDQVRFERVWLSLLPVEARTRAREMWRDIESRVGAYTRSELIQGILAGILLGVGLSLLHVPYASLLALVGAIAWLIPWVGLAFALVLVLLAASSVSLVLSVVAFGYTLVILLFMKLVIEPRLIDREHFSSLLTLLMVVALGSSFGVMGFVIAPPLAAAIQLVGRHMQARPATPLTDESIQRITDLDQHLAVLQEKLAQAEEPSPQLLSMVSRLNHLLERAREVMEVERQTGRLTSSYEPPTRYPGKVTMR